MTTIELNTKRQAQSSTTLEIALPAPGDNLDQDQEWVVVRNGNGWKKIRLHDYDDVYSVPGLYEKWIYEIFNCQSPQQIGNLLASAMRKLNMTPENITTLDLGAGNGCVAEELRRIDIRRFVGVDIYDEARDAANRDRPGLYDDYIVGDLACPDLRTVQTLDRYKFNCLTCVAALGFGDIPPTVFVAAFNRIENGGLIAFTIKKDFLDPENDSGFPTLIRRMLNDNAMKLISRERYQHRISTDGNRLMYEAFVGRKESDIPENWL
jgi:hypothetical protein